MPKIVSIEEMRKIEAVADAQGHSYDKMMDYAGQAVAERVLVKLSTDFDFKEAPRVVILIGPGNNGGDGLVVARYLRETYEVEVSCYLLKPREDDALLEAAKELGVFVADAVNDIQHRVLKNLVINADVLVDALFGIGARLPIQSESAALLRAVKAAMGERKERHPYARYMTPTQMEDGSVGELSLEHFREELPAYFPDKPYVIAVDCPSGLNCDTGEIDPLTIDADETVTFGAAKCGLFSFPGADAVGLLHIADIGLPPKLKELNEITLELASAATVRKLLPPRPRNSHKGTFGKTFIVAGSLNFIGAAYLCAAAAYRVGTGLVTVAVPQVILNALAPIIPEATWILLPNNMGIINKGAAKVVREEIEGYTALLVGPGIGNEDDTREFIEDLLQPKGTGKKSAPRMGLLGNRAEPDDEKSVQEVKPLPPMVIDADGLNALSHLNEWWKLLPANTIITPHPAEFGRLSGLDRDEIQAKRVDLARDKAKEWNIVVVLKGAFTVIAAPDGRVTVSPFASASLATAGTGDVLAGAITGLLAQGLQPYEAAVAGVWLHGWAGTHEQPNRGNVASDVVDVLTLALQVAEMARH